MLLGCSSPTNRPQYDQTPLPPLHVAVVRDGQPPASALQDGIATHGAGIFVFA